MIGKRKHNYAVVAVTAILFQCSTLLAQAPQLINYQGKLNQGGSPANGTFDITFTIYDDATGGTAQFAETHTGVTVTDGAFNVLIGSVLTLPTSVFSDDGDRFLGISVDGDAEMTPRFRFTSVAYAQRAAVADVALSGSGSIDGNSLDAADGDPVDAVFVNNNGDVGIGTTTPSEKLTIAGHALIQGPDGFDAIGEQAKLYLGNSAKFLQATIFGSTTLASDDPILIQTTNPEPVTLGANGSNNQLVLDPNGTVGIGIEAPRQALDVNGAISANAYALIDNQDRVTSFLRVNLESLFTEIIPTHRDAGITFLNYDENTNLMTMMDNGNVGVGTTNPKSIFHLEGNSQNFAITFINRANQIGRQGFRIAYDFDRLSFQRATDTGDFDATLAVIEQKSGNFGIGVGNPSERLEVDGNILATGTITEGSSRTYKDNIESLTVEEAATAIEELRPVKYTYKSDNSHDLSLGFIAEDVPELVARPDRKSLRTMDIVAALTKVVQEQQKTIKDLTRRLEILETQK